MELVMVILVPTVMLMVMADSDNDSSDCSRGYNDGFYATFVCTRQLDLATTSSNDINF